MTPNDLDRILAILKSHGVASAEVPTPSGALRVVFGPEAAPVGDVPSPGGWKSPVHLDAEFDPNEVMP